MRVISGSARRLQLKTVNSLDTRPTTDRIKETLFNILQNDIYDCKFLDLFSGSGAIGIEALSRGAKIAYFSDTSKDAILCIRDNLKTTKLSDKGVVMECSAITAINRLETTGETFDIIFMDPPYNKLYEKEILEKLVDSKIADSNTVIIIEASLETTFDYLENMGYTILKIKEYKTNKHVFVAKER